MGPLPPRRALGTVRSSSRPIGPPLLLPLLLLTPPLLPPPLLLPAVRPLPAPVPADAGVDPAALAENPLLPCEGAEDAETGAEPRGKPSPSTTRGRFFPTPALAAAAAAEL